MDNIRRIMDLPYEAIFLTAKDPMIAALSATVTNNDSDR